MTASESNTAANPGDSAPPFPVAAWGYDRHLVDLHVAELVQQLAEQRRRGDQAEQALSQLKIHTGRAQGAEGGAAALEADMAEVLQQAGVIAARVLAEAGKRIEATIVAAGARAADRLKAAAQQASRLERQARQLLADAELAWQDAVRQRRLLEAVAGALATHRQRMVEQLGRLYAPLGLIVVDADEQHQEEKGGSGIQIDDQPWPSC